MFKKATYGVLLAILVIGVSLSFGFYYYHHSHTNYMDTLVNSLELNEEQQKQLQEIKVEIADQWKASGVTKSSLIDEVVNALSQEEYDREAFNEAITKYGANLSNMTTVYADQFDKFHQMLTPKQREKLVDIIKSHKNLDCNGAHGNT